MKILHVTLSWILYVHAEGVARVAISSSVLQPVCFKVETTAGEMGASELVEMKASASEREWMLRW